MILVFNGQVMATPAATQDTAARLLGLMQHAIEKWHREGRPLSNQG
jgi:hypothetical protein